MKENEAPEKIYVRDDVFPTHVDWEGSPINTKRIDNHDIEYTRTDAFIDKACEYLNDWFTDDSCRCNIPITKSAREDFFDDFKNHMKGE